MRTLATATAAVIAALYFGALITSAVTRLNHDLLNLPTGF